MRLIESITSTADAYWVESAAQLILEANDCGAVIEMETVHAAQSIDGFGGCFNELGWRALLTASENGRREVIEALFSSDKGCGFSHCRMPIGANDFSTSWYSHCEHKDDYLMERFSIARDFENLIPYIREAQQVQSDLKIWASPWCPPTWMKKSGMYASAAVNSNWGQVLGHDSQDIIEASYIREEAKVLEAYALYFVKFLEAYANLGIPVYAVHPQNEVFAHQIFPSCLWKKEVMVTFIAEYLAPALKRAGLDTEVWFGTMNADDQEYTEYVINHPSIRDEIVGAGFQWAAKHFLASLNRKPELKLMQTESECHNGSNSWDTAFLTFELMRQYFDAGANSYMYWNMVLDEWGLSNWGWRQNSLVTIAHETGAVTYNPEFYVMRHFSAFVDAGSQYLSGESEGVDCVSCARFRNPDSSIVVVIGSASSGEEVVKLKFEDSEHTLALPPKSVSSLRWQP